MNIKHIIILILFLVKVDLTIAQSTTWDLAGNNGTTPTNDYLGTQDATRLVIRTNAIEKMTVLSGGNVGIGISSPGNLLHMNKTGAADDLYLQWTNGNTTYNQGMIMGINTSNQGVINMKDQKPIRFYTDNTLRMEVTGAGKVGIGTDQA